MDEGFFLLLSLLFFLTPHTTKDQSRVPMAQPVWLTMCPGAPSVSPTGFRSVPLKNGYDENLELASLLVHINIRQAGVSDGHSCKNVAIMTPPALTRPRPPTLPTFVAQRVEEELYSSSNQLKKQFEGGAEPFLYDTHSNLQRTSLPRQHHNLMREPSTPTGQAHWLDGF